MIKQGSKGSICFYFKGVLISGFPLTHKKNTEAYLYHGEHLIRTSKGINIKDQIKICLNFCNMIYSKKINKQRINTDDHIYFLYSLCALLRLRIIENDDLNGYYTFPCKKLSRVSY